jgi:hypothetical protein
MNNFHPRYRFFQQTALFGGRHYESIHKAAQYNTGAMQIAGHINQSDRITMDTSMKGKALNVHSTRKKVRPVYESIVKISRAPCTSHKRVPEVSEWSR